MNYRGLYRDYLGTTMGDIKGDTRSFDYGSYNVGGLIHSRCSSSSSISSSSSSIIVVEEGSTPVLSCLPAVGCAAPFKGRRSFSFRIRRDGNFTPGRRALVAHPGIRKNLGPQRSVSSFVGIPPWSLRKPY